jgi:hypothetical protein
MFQIVGKIIGIAQKTISIPEIMFCSNEKIFWNEQNIFPVAQKMISMVAKLF